MALKYLVTSGADGHTTFASFADWLASIPATLTEPEELKVPDASFDVTSNDGLSIGPFTTTAANYIRIFADPADRHNGKPRSATGHGARIVDSGGAVTVRSATDYFRIDGLEILETGASIAVNINGSGSGASNDVRIENCLISDTGNDVTYTVDARSANLNLIFRNNVVYGARRSIITAGANSVLIENSDFWRTADNIGVVCGSELTIKNSYSGKASGTTADFLNAAGTSTGNNNASSDGTAASLYPSGGLGSIAGSAVFASVTAGSENFFLKTGTNALATAGVTLGDDLYDAAGTARTSGGACAIGAFEPGAGVVTPTLSSPTATATGPTSASYSVTTNESGGTLYRLFSTNATETAATIQAANLTQAVTTAGAQTGNTTTALTQNTTYYGHFVYVDGSSATSAVANTPSFTTPIATPAPTGTITSTTVDGDTVTISGTTTNTPTSGLATLPAAATNPNGAVAQSNVAVTLSANAFTVIFTSVAPGNYDSAIITLSNSGGTSSPASGGTPVTIIGATQGSVPPSVVTTATVSGVSVTPATASPAGSSTVQFSATVSGTNSPAQTVTWSATGGSITTGGLFTFPASTGSIQTITVTATSTADTSKSGTATVTIPAVAPSVTGVSVAPSSSTVPGGSTVQFAATVSGTNNPPAGVTWSASAGSIGSGGLWTAPATGVSIQYVTITATSTFDGSKSGTASVTVPAFDVPGTTLGIIAIAGMGTVTITVMPPASNGGTPIVGYRVTASSGEVVNATGNVVTFILPAFKPVSFTGLAINAIGPGPASGPSNTVIPLPVESTNPGDYTVEPAPRERIVRL